MYSEKLKIYHRIENIEIHIEQISLIKNFMKRMRKTQKRIKNKEIIDFKQIFKKE